MTLTTDDLPFYDTTEAKVFIAQRTGEPLEAVGVFLDTMHRYMQLCDICEPEDVEAIEAERKTHADLIAAPYAGSPVMDMNMFVSYAQRVTDLSVARIANMQLANTAYEAEQGIVDDTAYPDCQEWANEMIAAQGLEPASSYAS